MTIKVGQKWVCTVDSFIYGDGGRNDVIHSFKKGDIIEITEILQTEPYPYYIDLGFPLNEKEILDNFILLAEFRNQRIDEILED